MAFSLSARLGLKRPLAGHGFSRQEWFDNLTLLDTYPGVFPCTVAATPVSWGAAQAGQLIIQTDSVPIGLMWRWTGTVFQRFNPIGMLATPVEISADFTTASTTPQVAISAPVTIPATTAGSTAKRIRIDGHAYAVENGTSTTLGAAELSITRDGTVIAIKRCNGRPSAAASPLDWGIGHDITAYDNPTAGAHTYALCLNSIAAIGGTSRIVASATQIARIGVVEVGT